MHQHRLYVPSRQSLHRNETLVTGQPSCSHCACSWLALSSWCLGGGSFSFVFHKGQPLSTDAFKGIQMMITTRNMDAPKLFYQEQMYGRTDWLRDDHFVDEVNRALIAGWVLAIYPVYCERRCDGCA